MYLDEISKNLRSAFIEKSPSTNFVDAARCYDICSSFQMEMYFEKRKHQPIGMGSAVF